MSLFTSVHRWICPACGVLNHEWIHNALGPFIFCTCYACGTAYPQREVGGEHLPPPVELPTFTEEIRA